MSSYAPKPTDPFRLALSKQRLEKKPWDRVQQKLTDIELTDEFFKNTHGCYRWHFIRCAYFNEFIDVDRVVELSKKWRNQTEYLWLEAISKASGEVKGNLFFKCAKRGNDVYKSRLKKRFDFLGSLDPIYFFLDNQKIKYSPMIFATNTVDPKRYTLNEAWSLISKELHLFDTKLRQAYGPFVKFRVWEAHESGYPHCHTVYFFLDKWFKAIPHTRKKDGKLIYIIPSKHKNKISNFWRMGNTDIQAVQDTHGAFSEVKKYITKNIWSEKGDLTNAMVCLHNKQMYSLSRCDPFLKRLNYWKRNGITNWQDQERSFMANLSKWAKKDFIGAIWGTQLYFQFYKERGDLAEPNAAALVREFLHNCNTDDIIFRYIGCVSAADLYDSGINCEDAWVLCADPPPELKYLLGFTSDLYSFAEEL